MKIHSFGAGVSALVLALALGAAPAFAEGAAAGGNESPQGDNRYTSRGNVVVEQDQSRNFRNRPSYSDGRGVMQADRPRSFDRDDRRRFDRSNFDGRFERRGSYAYYNGHRGYSSRRSGYREHNGFWFPLAAFAAGALIAGAAQPAPVYVAPSPHVDWCRATYRSYNPYDNTFQPFHGPRAYCISPYS